MKKAKKAKRRQLPCSVALEISREEIKMVIVEQRKDGAHDVRGYQKRWLQKAAGLNAPGGVAELTGALREFVEQHKLTGGTIQVALNSDFCVTRVLAGDAYRLTNEMNHLRERAAHYLSLGAGPKAVSECIRPLDAKSSQGWLTVTNRETLDNVVAALEDAGLYAALIEHSMVAVSRAVGRMGGDSASPAILIEPGNRGVDLGISYRGKLLFDYRPGGIHSQDHVAEIVEKHLERIRRYCTRFFRFASGEIDRVFLVGDHERAEQIRAQFAHSRRLNAEVLRPQAICSEWNFDEDMAADAGFLAPLGTAFLKPAALGAPANTREYPDLMDVLRLAGHEPLWPEAQRHLWPIAAAAVLGLLGFGWAYTQHRAAAAVERELAAAEADSVMASTLKLEMESVLTRSRYLSIIDQDLVHPPLHELIARIVRGKPAGVYMTKISLDADQNVLFQGAADSTEFVYAFEEGLKRIGQLQNVAIAGMSPERLPTNPNAIGFQIKCKFAG